MKRTLTIAALVAAVTASTATADTMSFINRCTPGSMKACASLVVTTTAYSGGTMVTIRVTNLQGTFSWDQTQGSLITRIGIVAPSISGGAGLTVTAQGGATATGTPGPLWVLRNPGGLGGPIELDAGILTNTNGGIAGCSAPAGGYPANYFSTCGGWVEFSFTTTNTWSASNAELAWLTRNMTNPVAPNGAIECDTQPNNAGRAVCAEVVPEPITMVLLGSGLAGMTGFGVVRRRRKGNDIENA
jgi:hypothetical protein